MMPRKFIMLIVVPLLLIGCAVPPNNELAVLKAAANQRGVQINTYDIEKEMYVQNNKFFKNYDQAKAMIANEYSKLGGINPNSARYTPTSASGYTMYDIDGHSYIMFHSGVVHSASCNGRH